MNQNLRYICNGFRNCGLVKFTSVDKIDRLNDANKAKIEDFHV